MRRVELEVLRTRLGFTQQDMADKCEIKRGTYSKIERGLSNGNEKFWLNVMRVGNLTPEQLFQIQYEIQLSKQE